ncbi:MAG: hypothetical protein ACREQ1_05900 [Woeseiaceae bacterium]
MAEDYVATVRIRRPAKVTTDNRGRSVWAETIETAELELVSTSELQKILDSTDDDTRSAIERVVTGEEEGVLARDPATGLFEIISDADLQAILDSNDDLSKTVRSTRPADVTLEPVSRNAPSGGEELSLVSTQVLRKILGKDNPQAAKKPTTATKPAKPVKDKSGGFDPYNSG